MALLSFACPFTAKEKGKTQAECDRTALSALTAGFAKIHIDVGTGSGRYVLRQSMCAPDTFTIGIDPVAAAMQPAAQRLQKAARRGGKLSALFVVACAPAMPEELSGMATSLSVHLPWGSLRDGLVLADEDMLRALRGIATPGAPLEVLLGCDEARDAAVMAQRALPPLSCAHFEAQAASWRRAGFAMRCVRALDNAALRGYSTEWAKRLAYGRPRTTYLLTGKAL